MSRRLVLSKLLNICGFFIDPQNDFMGERDGTPLANGIAWEPVRAALPVAGAYEDMSRLAGLVARLGESLSSIYVTLDTHHRIDIAHAWFWIDADGKRPTPFTIISHEDVRTRRWEPRNPLDYPRALHYVEMLERQGNYPLIIWPEHCLFGTWGHDVVSVLAETLARWEEQTGTNVDYVLKGMNPFTEHYGAIAAEVVYPDDPSTMPNEPLLAALRKADVVVVAGEASSHCVRETLLQIKRCIGREHMKKFHLLTDCMSPVAKAPGTPDFPAIAEQMLQDMRAAGMTLTTSAAFMA